MSALAGGRKGSGRIVPRLVRMKVLPLVDPAGLGHDDRKLRELVHAQMETELAKLRRMSGSAVAATTAPR